jgi:hypothetical protein
MYDGCYESQDAFRPSAKSQPFNSEAGTVRADRHGPWADGGRLFYAAEAKTRSSCGVLSFSFDSRGEPTPLCSQRGGAILAEAGLDLEGVYEGHGFLGEGESRDREGVEGDRAITL